MKFVLKDRETGEIIRQDNEDTEMVLHVFSGKLCSHDWKGRCSGPLNDDYEIMELQE